MPRFVKATDIPMEKRRPHLDRYKAQLRDALTHPALSSDQRAEIRHKLATLGQLKPYAQLAAQRASAEATFFAREGIRVPQEAKTAPSPEVAPEPERESTTEAVQNPSPVVGETLDDLLGRSKTELTALAEAEEVEVRSSWTKAQIAKALLDARGGE